MHLTVKKKKRESNRNLFAEGTDSMKSVLDLTLYHYIGILDYR